jgi:hypothetical protein
MPSPTSTSARPPAPAITSLAGVHGGAATSSKLCDVITVTCRSTAGSLHHARRPSLH